MRLLTTAIILSLPCSVLADEADTAKALPVTESAGPDHAAKLAIDDRIEPLLNRKPAFRNRPYWWVLPKQQPFTRFIPTLVGGIDGNHPWQAGRGPSLEETTTLGSYPPNGFGLCDMHGNVWEWCSDWYGIDYYAKSPPSDPLGPAAGTSRVVRGGSWDFGALHARSAARDQRAPDYRDQNLGFRVVRVAENEDTDL